VYSPPDLTRPTFDEATKHDFRPAKVGDSFGPSWATHWFRITLTVPKDLRDKNHLEFVWEAGNEGLIWHEDGVPVHGLTGGGDRTQWILPKEWYDGKAHVFYIEMACNQMFGNAAGGDSIQPPSPDKYYQLSVADITAVNLEARALSMDFWFIGDAAREFPDDSWESHKALDVANRIMDTFYEAEGSDESIKECRKIAQEFNGALVDSSKVYDSDQPELVYGIGNCHIDTCWLWPWAETKRKVARSWSNQCDLIDRYPEYRFCCSQGQQYKWLETYYPAIFDRVKAKIKEGTFQPIGGSWVEHDTNMPSGESLVRQFLLGQRYFESRFGIRCNTFWLPDTFGYSAQIPQICRLAGMTRFFTQKLSWNNINNFPHTTFNWVALDGSQVLTHMTPVETYTAEANFGDLLRCMSQHKSLDQDNTSLLPYGKGDGGGGATWEHIEKLRRGRGISDTVGRLPRVKIGNSVDDFYAQVEKNTQKKKIELANWYGELYFEFHRGTYTTQANNKRNNRLSEFLLREAEYLCTMASIKDVLDPKSKATKYKYPKKEIDFMWEAVCLCQFHDCLPGSSIEMCYDDSDKLYKEVFETGQKIVQDALEQLGFDSPENPDKDLVLVNTLPWDRSDLYKRHKSFDTTKDYLFPVEDNSLQSTLRDPPSNLGKATAKETSKGVFELSNAFLKIKIENGVITSIYDKLADREVIPAGQKANQFVIFDDKPLYWQAWDVEVYHLSSRQELTSTESSIVESGPIRASVVTQTKISKDSWLKSTISLSANLNLDIGNMIEVETEVEWRESMKFLKVEFPVDVSNTEASYECQYGMVKRPTHYNTSWDMAKFEVCCHKWADLSEANYGVSILNDSKYGFATAGNLMRLSLLRAPKAPDAHADMGKYNNRILRKSLTYLGRHVIRYAIFPHIGTLDYRTVKAGYIFNSPQRAATHTDPKKAKNLLKVFSVSEDNIVIDCVKRGEDDEDVSIDHLPTRATRSVVVRLFDCLGGKTNTTLEWTKLDVAKVFIVNILEDDLSELKIQENSVTFPVRAFEVVTLRLELA
jgi:alpha-mannosidase